MFSNKQLQKILTNNDIVKKEDFIKYQEEAKKKNKRLENYLFDEKIISPLVLYENAASFYKIPFTDLKNQTIRKDVLFQIPEPIASSHQLIPFDADDKEIKLAVLDPEDIEMLQDLIMAAVNDGISKAKEMVNEEMGKLTGGLNLPNIPGLSL